MDAYPETCSTDTTDTIFGERIADPYRWLENDVRTDEEVADWVDAQDVVTDAYSHGFPSPGGSRPSLPN